MSEFLYIFLHIPKTAGSTFINHIKKNLIEDEYLELEYEDLGLLDKKLDRVLYLKKIEKYLSQFNCEQKDKIKIIFGPALPYGIHTFFNKKPRYFTFLRNPAGRIISIYNYLITNYKREKPEGKKHKRYDALLVNKKIPSFEKWLKSKYSSTYSKINTTTIEFLTSLGYLDRKSLRGLRKFFFVGLKKRFNDDSLYLYGLLGFNKFFISENISKKYVPNTYKEKVKKISPKNLRENLELFHKAEEYNKKLTKKANYKTIVSKMKIKRFLLFPITQLMYGFNDLVRESKNKIKDYLFSFK